MSSSTGASGPPGADAVAFEALAQREVDRARVRAFALAGLGGLAALLGAVAAVGVFAPGRRPEPGPAPAAPQAATVPAAEAAATPAPLRFQPLAPIDAYRANAAIPDSRQPDPPARPYVLPAANGSARARDAACLTQAVYYEAASESLEGQRAVAQVVLNRVRDARFPDTVCGVVFQGAARATGCQFSFTCDGSMRRSPAAVPWRRAQAVADAALDGYVMAAIGHATHYHTVWVTPYWSPSLVKWGRIGAHIFYRWAGGGQARAAGPAAPVEAPADAASPPYVASKADPAPEPPIAPPAAAVERDAAARLPSPVAVAASAPAPGPPVEAPVPVVPPPYVATRRRTVLDSPAFAARDQGGPRP